MKAQAAARAALVAAIRADDAAIVIDKDLMRNGILPVVLGEPPADFIRAVDHYGAGVQDPSTLWRLMGTRLFDGNEHGLGVFPEIANPPELALAEIRLAKLYRKLARQWR